MTKTTENIKCQMFVTQENSAVVNNGHSKGMDIQCNKTALLRCYYGIMRLEAHKQDSPYII
jgi:hypothetical protein